MPAKHIVGREGDNTAVDRQCIVCVVDQCSGYIELTVVDRRAAGVGVGCRERCRSRTLFGETERTINRLGQSEQGSGGIRQNEIAADLDRIRDGVRAGECGDRSIIGARRSEGDLSVAADGVRR